MIRKSRLNYYKELRTICPKEYLPQITQAFFDCQNEFNLPDDYYSIEELVGTPEKFINDYLEDHINIKLLKREKTKLFKITLLINLIVVIEFGSLFIWGMITTLSQIYTYWILKTPYPPEDPPLIMLGIIVSGMMFFGLAFFSLISYLMIKVDPLGRTLNLIALIFYFFIFYFISIPFILIQLYAYLVHSPTVELFKSRYYVVS
ncbi:MAG: hypothetical protein OEZ01_15705 [Candidatus Heimdallarchaeota archaeon]|nr:hypothetical protein [Candidatus Heimdallarchaeota archaeon]MDH5647455.1 hypothetical protein [Candidatus Heimdallarchaeota archaeon]